MIRFLNEVSTKVLYLNIYIAFITIIIIIIIITHIKLLLHTFNITSTFSRLKICINGYAAS